MLNFKGGLEHEDYDSIIESVKNFDKEIRWNNIYFIDGKSSMDITLSKACNEEILDTIVLDNINIALDELSDGKFIATNVMLNPMTALSDVKVDILIKDEQ